MGILDKLTDERERRVRLTISMKAKNVEKIDELMREFGFKSRSYTIDKLVEIMIEMIEREKKRKKKHNLAQYNITHSNTEHAHNYRNNAQNNLNNAQINKEERQSKPENNQQNQSPILHRLGRGYWPIKKDK
jgi:hypothetical protein